jgi:hypothetical protein
MNSPSFAFALVEEGVPNWRFSRDVFGGERETSDFRPPKVPPVSAFT